jgi:hypothetical protein
VGAVVEPVDQIEVDSTAWASKVSEAGACAVAGVVHRHTIASRPIPAVMLGAAARILPIHNSFIVVTT